jgi:hypothetical protein
MTVLRSVGTTPVLTWTFDGRLTLPSGRRSAARRARRSRSPRPLGASGRRSVRAGHHPVGLAEDAALYFVHTGVSRSLFGSFGRRWFFDEFLEHASSRRMTKLAEHQTLDLPDAFDREPVEARDLLQRVRPSVLQSVP